MTDAERAAVLRGVLERHFPERLSLIEKFSNGTISNEDLGLLRDAVAHALFTEGHWDEDWNPKPSALALEDLISRMVETECE